jgi:PEP-CTERM motif
MKPMLMVFAALLCSLTVHADTVEDVTFSFSDTGTYYGPDGFAPSPTFNGSGSFQATVPPASLEAVITSLTGELNGQPMDFISGVIQDDPAEPFGDAPTFFTVDGTLYAIAEAEFGPITGETLYVGGILDPTEDIPLYVNLSYSVVPAPEPSTIGLVCLGLLGLMFVAWRRRGHAVKMSILRG